MSRPEFLEKSITDRFLAHVGQTSPFPNGLEPVRAAGCRIWDASGKEYLDFIAGIAVCNVGHCHPRVVAAVQQQAARYAHTMVYGEHVQDVQVALADRIAAVAPSGLDSVFFLTTGSEANDAALKMATKLTGRRKFLAFRKAYHGDTVGAAACFGDEGYRAPYARLLPQNVAFCDFGSFEALEAIDTETAAVLVEPVQGEGGIRVPACEWLPALRDRCNRMGTLLIFDEVQTGFGRIGDWFAANWFRTTPDIITMAKGMGAGYPLAGVLAPRDMLFRFAANPPFSHITTYGGHPVSCAAALAGMDVIEDENLLARTRQAGAWLLDQVGALRSEFPQLIGEARGVGLMIGVDFPNDHVAREVVVGSKAAGLIVESNLLSEHTIRLSPPLIVSDQELGQAVGILRQVLRDFSAGSAASR